MARERVDLFDAFNKNAKDSQMITSDIDYSTQIKSNGSNSHSQPVQEEGDYSEYMKYLIESPEELVSGLSGNTQQPTGNTIACVTAVEDTDDELTEMLKKSMSTCVIVSNVVETKEEMVDEELALLLLSYKLTNIRHLGHAAMVTVDTNTESMLGDIELPIRFSGKVTIIFQTNVNVQRMIVMSLHRHYKEVEHIGQTAIHDVLRILTGFLMPYSEKHRNGMLLVTTWVSNKGTIEYDSGSNFLGEITHKRRHIQNIIAGNPKSFKFFKELCNTYAIGYIKIDKKKNLISI